MTDPHPTVVELASGDSLRLQLEPGEVWWGGAVADGARMPYGQGPFARDLGAPAAAHGDADPEAPSNQSAPLLVSTTGRIVGSEHPFAFRFGDGTLEVDGADVELVRAGDTLRSAHLAASRRWFPPSGETVAIELIAAPQYNTWIELPWRPDQAGVLAYVRSLLDSGMPPGVVFIDDNWAPDHGEWRFDPARFPDPAGMARQLHEWGCSLMLWLVPFVSPDSQTFRRLEEDGLLVRDASGETAVRRWWNGYSALLDLSSDQAVAWLTDQLDALVALGVDGFKFDGGDVRDYRADDLLARPLEPVAMCEAWARIGLRYRFNEFRACWRMGGQPLGQRLQDKPPTWDETGIGAIIPEMLAQGVIGHAYACPDMVGGGEIGAMGSDTDQEFFVRYAQIAALSPMIQFSVAPNRVLDEEHLAAVHEALRIRAEHTATLVSLAQEAARTGAPIIRPMGYHDPELVDVVDQFFVGEDLVVAPVLRRGDRTRTVRLPAGRWRDVGGDVHEGRRDVVVDGGLAVLPRFVRV